MRKISDDQLNQLERLRNWSIDILDFMDLQAPSDAKNYIVQFKEVITQTYERKDLRGMSLISKDVTSWAKDLSKAQIAELNQILRKKFNEDLNYSQTKIEAILANGVIRKIAEYKLLVDYFEEIQSDESKKDEISKVSRVLTEYQEKIGKV